MKDSFSPFQAFNHRGPDNYRPAPTRSKISPEEVIHQTKLAGQAARLEVNGEMGAMMLAIFADLSNVYITGAAGTGKTTFLKHILVPELERRGLNYHITASTGIAGSHVDGKTLHSYLGIGLGPEWPPGVAVLNMEADEIGVIYEATYVRWQNNPRINAAMRNGLTKKLLSTEVLIVEEVSMIAGWGLLGYVDYFLKTVRGNDKPFGGIQMICVGDFGQLPPVERFMAARPDWAFLSAAWTDAKIRPMKFTKIHRQKAGWYTDFLNETHDGYPASPTNKAMLAGHVLPGVSPQTHPKFSFLCATNKEAETDNQIALRQYPGEVVTIAAQFDVREDQLKGYEKIEEVQRRLIEGKAAIRIKLELKIGLPVLIKVNNAAENYVNGTKGYIHRFTFDKTDPRIVTVIEVRVPHPDWPERLRSSLSSEDLATLEACDTIHSLGRRHWSRSSAEDPEAIEPVDPAAYAKAVCSGVTPVARRKFPVVSQFPLIPATAITIHSSQGMTLDEVVIRADRAFAPGQVYVALSRLRAPEGLVLASMDLPIFADPTATAFNRAIEAPSVNMGAPLPELPPEPEQGTLKALPASMQVPATAPDRIDLIKLLRNPLYYKEVPPGATFTKLEVLPSMTGGPIRSKGCDAIIDDDIPY